MRLLLRNHRGIANRFDSRKPQAPKEPSIIAKVKGGADTAQFNEFMQELEEEEPGSFAQFMFDNVGLPETVHTQEFTKESEQDEMGEEEIQQLGLELQWETVAPHLFYPRFNIMRKRANEEIIQEKLNEYDAALNINFEEHISLRLHSQQHVKKKSLELFFHKVDIPMIRTYISQGIHFLTSDFFGRLFSQQKMAILRYLLEQKIFEEANFIDNKFLQVYLAHFLNNPKNDFLLNLICYQRHLLKGSWPEDEPHYYQRFCYNDKDFIHDMPIMIKDILTRTQNSTDVLHRLRIYWSMQKMYLFQQDNIDLIIEELKYTYFKTGNKDEMVAIKKEIGKIINSSFSYVPFKHFIHNLVHQSSTFKDFMAFFSVSIILLSHLKSMNEMLEYDDADHNYLYEYLHQNLEREQLNPIFLMVFQLLNHEDHRRADYENFKRSYDSYLRFDRKSRKLPNPTPISSLITKYKNLEFVYERNPKAPSFTKFSITLDRSFFKSKVNQPRKYFEQKDMIQCLVKKDYQSVLNHFLTTFTFTGQKQKVDTFYKKMKDADKNLSFKTRNEQAFYKMKLAKQIFFTHSLPQPLSFLKTKPIKETYNALTLINDNFIDHDEHLQQFDIMNKFHLADIITRNLKIDNEKYAQLAQQQPDSDTLVSQTTSISYDVTETEQETSSYTHPDEIEGEQNKQAGANFDKNLSLNPFSTVEYDSDGNPISSTEYDSDGNPISSVEYDSDGNPIQYQEEVDEDGNPIQNVELDQNGNPIQNVELDSDGNPIQIDGQQQQQQVGITQEQDEDSQNSQQFDEDDELSQEGSQSQQATQESGDYFTSTAQQQVPPIPFTPFDDKKMKQFNQKVFMRSVISGILFTPEEIEYINKNLVAEEGEASEADDYQQSEYPSSTQLEEYEKNTSEQQQYLESQQQDEENEQTYTPNSSQFYYQSTQDSISRQQVTGSATGENQSTQQQGNTQSQETEKRESQLEQNQEQQETEGNQQQVIKASNQQQIQQSNSQQIQQTQSQLQNQESQQQDQNQQSSEQDQNEELQQENQNKQSQQKIQSVSLTTQQIYAPFTTEIILHQSTDLPSQYKVKEFRDRTSDMDTELIAFLDQQSCSQISKNSLNQAFTGTLPLQSTTVIEESSTQYQIIQGIIQGAKEQRRKQQTSPKQKKTRSIEQQYYLLREGEEEEQSNENGEKTTLINGEAYTETEEGTNVVTEQQSVSQPENEDSNATAEGSTDLTGEQITGQTGEGTTFQTGTLETISTSELQKFLQKMKDISIGEQSTEVTGQQSTSTGIARQQKRISVGGQQKEGVSGQQSLELTGEQLSENYQLVQGGIQYPEVEYRTSLEELSQSGDKIYQDDEGKLYIDTRSLRNKNQQTSEDKAKFQYQIPKDKKLKEIEERFYDAFGKTDYTYNQKSAYSYHLFEQGEITTEQGPEKQYKTILDNYHKKIMYRQAYYQKDLSEENEEIDPNQVIQMQEGNPFNHPSFIKRKQDYRRIRNYIQQIADLQKGQKLQFKYNVTPQQVYSEDSQQTAPIYKIKYTDIKTAEFYDDRQLKTFHQIPVFDKQKKLYQERIRQINHIWNGKKEARISELRKAANAANKDEVAKKTKEVVNESEAGEDVSEAAINEIYNSMYKQGTKKQSQSKINTSKPSKSNTNKYNFSKTNRNRFQFCTVTPQTVIHPPVHLSIIDFTKIDQYKTKPVDNDFLRTLQTELQIPKVGSGIILAQYLFLQGKSQTKTSIINPKKTLNIQFTSVVGTRTKNYEQYIKKNLFNYALSEQLYTSLLESQVSKYNRSQFKKIIAHFINFNEELSDNIVRLICKICQRQKIGYTFVEIVELIRVNNVKMTSQALEIVTFLWQKFDIINEDMFPFLKLYTRKMQIPLRTQFYSEFCKSLIKTKKFNKLQIITSAILLELKPKQFKIDVSMNNLKADQVSQLQKQWKSRQQQNYLRLYLELIDVIVTNLDNYVPPFMNEYFDEYLKLKNSLNEKELGLAFICYSHKRDKFVQLLNKLDGEPEKGTTYMYDCLMKAILANFETLQDLTERSLDTTVLKNRLVLSLPQINKSLVIFKKCSSSNSFSKFLEHCLRFQQTLEQHSDIKRQMFFILNNNVEQVSVGGIFNLLDFIFNEKRAKERIDYRAIKLSEEEKSRKLDLIRGSVTKVNSQEGKAAVKQQKKTAKKKGKKNEEGEEESAVVQSEVKKEQITQVKQKYKKEQSTDGSDNSKKDQKKKNKKDKKQQREKQASLLDQILAEKQSIGPGEGQAKGASEAEILGMIKTQGKRHESTKRKCIKSMNRLFEGALELQRQQQAAKVLEAEKKVLAAKQPVVEKKKGGAEGKKGKK